MSRPGSRSTAIFTIGAVFLVYGLAAMCLAELLSLVGLQAADEGMVVWPAFVFMPVIPALLALSGWALMRGSPWGYRGALLLPLPIVPLAVWTLNGTGRPGTLGDSALQAVAVGAVFASASVPLSLALLFIWVKALTSARLKRIKR